MSRKIRRNLTPGAERLEDRKLLFSFGAIDPGAMRGIVVHWDQASSIRPAAEVSTQAPVADYGLALTARARPTESI